MNVIFDASNHDTDGVVFDAPIDGAIVVRGGGYIHGLPRPFGGSEIAAIELNGGYFDLRIMGSVSGVTNPFSTSMSIRLGVVDPATVDLFGRTSSLITVGSGGNVQGPIVAGHALTLFNHGIFNGSVRGSSGPAEFFADQIFNTGEFGDAYLGTGDDVFVNKGTAGLIEMSDGNDRVNNSDFVSGYVDLGTGNDILQNSGVLDDVIWCGEGNDRVINTGELAGHGSIAVDYFLDLGDGDDILRNEGLITGIVGVGQGSDTVINNGVINGGIYLDAGDNRLFNSGTIGTFAIFGAGDDIIVNSGSLTYVYMEGGDDVFRNSGTFEELMLGWGNDRFYGGEGSETLHGEGGDDIYWFGGGDDAYFANSNLNAAATGHDIIYGGSNSAFSSPSILGRSGGDLYDFSGRNAVTINLSSVAFNGWRGDAGLVIGGNTAISSSGDLDRIYEFELATGGQESDIIIGNADQNHLIGDGGDDQLLGGRGRDLLQGDAGSDEFIYLAFSDSTVARAGRDIIFEFDANDVIVFSGFGLVADVRVQGETFTGVAGEVKISRLPYGWTLKFDMDGDAKADMAIDVSTMFTGTTFTSDNFDFL